MPANNGVHMLIRNHASTLRVFVAVAAFITLFLIGATRAAAAQTTAQWGGQVVDALYSPCHGSGAGKGDSELSLRPEA